MALRLASSDILPFDPTLQATALEGYVADLSTTYALMHADKKDGGIDLTPLSDAVAAFRVAAEAVVGSRAGAGAGVSGDVGGRGDDATLEGFSVTAAAEARAVTLRGGGSAVGGGHRISGGSGYGGGEGGEDSKVEDEEYARAGRLVAEELNERLAMTERRFLWKDGLPGRQWFRHVLQAPGLYLG